jgi:hypothetical protein
MSSPKRAPATQRVARGKAARKAAPAKTALRTAAAASDASAEARALAGTLERALINGDVSVLDAVALQELMAALCKTYSAQIEAGHDVLPLRGRTSVSSTDIMTTASGLLKASNLAVFELGMWQSWTGR